MKNRQESSKRKDRKSKTEARTRTGGKNEMDKQDKGKN